MGEAIKNYLKEIALNKDGNMFLFNQFYLHPDIILGGEDESTIDKYYKYGRIKELLTSYKIFEFMLLCMSDCDFRERIDGRKNLVRKMNFMAYDFREFRNKYREDFNNESFIRMLYGKEEIGNWREKYHILELLSYKEFYDKNGWLYNIGLDYEKAMNVDDNMVKQLMYEISWWQDVYYEKYIIPERKEERFIRDLEKREYYDVLNRISFYEENPGYMDKNTLRALVCSNKLLDLCKRKLLRRNLSFNVMDKIIELIEMSIDLREENFEEDSQYEWYYNMVGKKRVSEYNSELAYEVIDRFHKKMRNTKVLKLY